MKRLKIYNFFYKEYKEKEEEDFLLYLLFKESESSCSVRVAPRRFWECSGVPASFRICYYNLRAEPPVCLFRAPLPFTVRNGRTIIDLYGVLAKQGIALTVDPSRDLYTTMDAHGKDAHDAVFGKYGVVEDNSLESGIICVDDGHVDFESWVDMRCDFLPSAVRLGNQSILLISVYSRWSYESSFPSGLLKPEYAKRIISTVEKPFRTFFAQVKKRINRRGTLDAEIFRRQFFDLKDYNVDFWTDIYLQTDQATIILRKEHFHVDTIEMKIDLEYDGKSRRWNCESYWTDKKPYEDALFDALEEAFDLVIHILQCKSAAAVDRYFLKLKLIKSADRKFAIWQEDDD